MTKNTQSATASNEAADITVSVVEIALSVEEWRTVLHWLQYGEGYHMDRMHEWLINCADKKKAASTAAEHQKAATKAGNLYKIIEGILYPQPTPGTE